MVLPRLSFSSHKEEHRLGRLGRHCWCRWAGSTFRGDDSKEDTSGPRRSLEPTSKHSKGGVWTTLGFATPMGLSTVWKSRCVPPPKALLQDEAVNPSRLSRRRGPGNLASADV